MLVLFVFMAEGAEMLLLGLDSLALIADVVARIRGKPNRQERKAAKASGIPGPKPDRWYWAVVMLTSLTVLLTAVLVIRFAAQA